MAAGLAEPLDPDQATLRTWSSHQVLTWFERPEISGTPRIAAQNARLVLESGRSLTRELLLELGRALLRARALEAAVSVYGRAYRIDAESRYHFGQSLLDFLLNGRASQADLRVLAGLRSVAVDAIVPDLAKHMLELLEPEDGDEALVAGLAAAAGPDRALQAGRSALANGASAMAGAIFRGAAASQPTELGPRLMIGVGELLSGRISEAERHFAVLEASRELEQARWGVAGMPLTIMHESWLESVGRLASLGTFFKAADLGWLPKQRSVLAFDNRRPPAGWPLLSYLGQNVAVLAAPAAPAETIDRYVWGAEADIHPNPAARRASLTRSFWYGSTGRGEIRWYAAWAAEVERASPQQAISTLGEEERTRFRSLMTQVFGLPPDAWYVVLDLREADLRSENSGTVSSDIDVQTYDEAIDLIIRRGGWVVAMGEPWSPSPRPRPGLIDYATSGLRTPALDIELYAECRFFLGAHSGYSLVPPLFGRRCLLPNWRPTTLPSWHPGDVVLPMRPGSGRLTDLSPTGEGALANTAGEIAAATAELLDELDERTPAVLDPAQERFHRAMDALCGYHGARTSPGFLAAHPDLV